MKSGNRLWIISEEISINMLTKPRTQIPAGIFRISLEVLVMSILGKAACLWSIDFYRG